MELFQELKKVGKELNQISSKLDRILEMEERILRRLTEPKTLDASTLLSLPDHLRRTAMVILRVGEVTAEMVAKETGRARAVESGYLNQLERMGFIERKRKGRVVYFAVSTP